MSRKPPKVVVPQFFQPRPVALPMGDLVALENATREQLRRKPDPPVRHRVFVRGWRMPRPTMAGDGVEQRMVQLVVQLAEAALDEGCPELVAVLGRLVGSAWGGELVDDRAEVDGGAA